MTMMKKKTSSNWKHWLSACRPKTLPAAIFPILVAWANTDWTSSTRVPVILTTSVLLQVLSNFANDLFDGIRGNDGDDRKGPTRTIQNGLISKREMLLAVLTLVAVLCLLGLILFAWSSWVILLLGIAAIISAIGYTASPYALAYNALGELAVGLFFGGIAVLGTEYILLDGHLSKASLPLALCMGLQAIAILLVNNIRDWDQDLRNGKYTLCTRIGRPRSEKLFELCLYLPPLIIAGSVTLGITPWPCLLVLFNLPISRMATKMLSISTTNLNSLLALSSFLLANFAALYVLGRILFQVS